ncbi:MAG: alanine dehydrogenase [Coriobacteriia bacterium]|nr:alanine dehydrogenase [Coriobacteriia bacterium]
MIIGVPAEIKNNEYRIGLTPGAAADYVAHGHTVIIQRGAGLGSSFPDEQYQSKGCEIVATAAEVYSRADMIVKVKEPQAEEIAMLREGQILYAYLHLAPDLPQTEGLIKSKAVCIAYETVELPDGSLPLLAPMSEVAGRMATQVGAHFLEKPRGGRGVLMGGVPGVSPANVIVLGGGVVGTNAAYVAKGMGAHVTVMDINLNRMRYLQDVWENKVTTLHSSRGNLLEILPHADLVIGGIYLPGAKAPLLVKRDMLSVMKPGSVVVDVAIDQGGCIETSKPTTHAEPIFYVDDILHYGVANMPGAVPNTSTRALSNATLRYGLALAKKGWKQALRDDPALARGANIIEGKVVYECVASEHGFDYTPLEEVIG